MSTSGSTVKTGSHVMSIRLPSSSSSKTIPRGKTSTLAFDGSTPYASLQTSSAMA